MQVVLEQVAAMIKGYMKVFIEQIVYEVLMSLMFNGFDVVKQAVMGSGGFTKEVVAGVVEQMSSWIGKMMEDVPEIMEGVKEVISTVMIDLWKNYVEAVVYVKENAI